MVENSGDISAEEQRLDSEGQHGLVRNIDMLHCPALKAQHALIKR